MIKEVDLLSYLPPLIQEYKEIKKITEAENPEFQLLWDADELVRNSIFILTATEQGLKRFEKLLGIYATPDDTIESRRNRVLTRWMDAIPYTYRYLIGVITVLTNGNFEIYPKFSEYALEIVTHISQIGAVDDLDYLLKTIMPCNIAVTSTNTLEWFISGNVWISSAFIPVMVYMVTNDFETSYKADGMAANGSTLIQSKVELVTNDFETSYRANGHLFGGSNAVVVSEILIQSGTQL